MFRDSGVDAYVCPSFGGSNLTITNLTGHPQVVVPNGFAPRTEHPRASASPGDSSRRARCSRSPRPTRTPPGSTSSIRC